MLDYILSNLMTKLGSVATFCSVLAKKKISKLKNTAICDFITILLKVTYFVHYLFGDKKTKFVTTFKEIMNTKKNQKINIEFMFFFSKF